MQCFLLPWELPSSLVMKIGRTRRTVWSGLLFLIGGKLWLAESIFQFRHEGNYDYSKPGNGGRNPLVEREHNSPYYIRKAKSQFGHDVWIRLAFLKSLSLLQHLAPEQATQVDSFCGWMSSVYDVQYMYISIWSICTLNPPLDVSQNEKTRNHSVNFIILNTWKPNTTEVHSISAGPIKCIGLLATVEGWGGKWMPQPMAQKVMGPASQKHLGITDYIIS